MIYRITLEKSAYYDVCAESPVEAMMRFRLIYPGKFAATGISQVTDNGILPLYTLINGEVSRNEPAERKMDIFQGV